MESEIPKEATHDVSNKPTPSRSETSLKGQPRKNSNEKPQEDKVEIEAKEHDQEKAEKPRKRWRFQYLTKDIEQAVSETQDHKENTESLQESCAYVLKNGKKNELVICLTEPRPSLWFKQFNFIKQESLKQVVETRSTNAQIAARELGPGYRILYNHDAKENDSQEEPKPFSQETIYLAQFERTNGEAKENEKRKANQNEEGEAEEVFESEESNPKSPEVSQHSAISLPKSSQRVENYSPRDIVSQWYLRIFGGETVDNIRQDFVKKQDPNSAWIFNENFDLLMKAKQKYEILTNKEKSLKRQYKEETNEEEHKGEKPKKVFVAEEKSGQKTVKNLSADKDDNKKKSLKKEKDKDKEVKLAQTDHDILAGSVAYYYSADYFNKSIRSLPLFQKELKAFQKTLTPEEIKIIDNAMETGFNPIHYIYLYRIGKKSIAQIRTGIYKRVTNLPSLELIVRYVREHIKVKKPEKETNGNDQEGIK